MAVRRWFTMMGVEKNRCGMFRRKFRIRFRNSKRRPANTLRNPSRGVLPMALMKTLQEHPEWRNYSAAILYATLGKALPEGAASAAVLWGAAQQFAGKHADAVRAAGIEDEGAGLGEALFQKMLSGRSGVACNTFWLFPTAGPRPRGTPGARRRPSASNSFDVYFM